MRYFAWCIGLLLLTGCGSSDTQGHTKLTLRDPAWEDVNVQIVITSRADCDARGEGFVSEQTFVMHRDNEKWIEVPDGKSLCWRHDRDPKHPVAGDWSGWTRATLNPGYPTKTDL